MSVSVHDVRWATWTRISSFRRSGGIFAIGFFFSIGYSYVRDGVITKCAAFQAPLTPSQVAVDALCLAWLFYGYTSNNMCFPKLNYPRMVLDWLKFIVDICQKKWGMIFMDD